MGAPVALKGRITPLATIVGRGSVRPAARRALDRTARWQVVGGPHLALGATRAAHPRLVSPQGVTAAFSPTLPGRYRLRLTARLGGQVTADQLTVTALPANPLVPIDTVVDSSSGPGIRYAGTTYPAEAVPGQPSEIVQVLVLNRQTLRMESNSSYTDTGLLQTALGRLKDTSLVIVSLQRPARPGNEPLHGPDLGKALAWIGFPDITVGNRAPGTLSAIGVPKTTADQKTAGNASVDLNSQGGGMKGYLTQDRWGNYGFVTSEQPTFTTPREKPCDPQPDPQACNHSGFRVIEVDPYTGQPIADRFFGTNDRNVNASAQDSQARMMGAFVDGIPAGVLVKIETVTNRLPGELGYRRPIGNIDPETMKNLAIIVDHVGGTRNGFNRAAVETGPDSGAPVYTLLGWGQAGEGNGAEASLGVDGAGDDPILSGTLRRDRSYRFRPVQTETFGSVSDELQQKIMARPDTKAWPLSGDPGAMRALAYLGVKQGTLGCDPRSSFWMLRLTTADAARDALQVGGIDEPSAGTIDPCTTRPVDFTDTQFMAARDELKLELGYVGNARSYLDRLSSPFAKGALTSWGQAMDISQKVYSASRNPNANVGMRWLEFTEIILKLLGPATLHITPEIADLMEFGVWLAGDKDDGAPGDQEVRFEAVKLGNEFIEQADNATATYGRLGDIVVSDWAKLGSIGQHGGCNPHENPDCPDYLALTGADTDAASAAFYRGIQRIAYETLVPAGFNVFELNQYPNPPNFPTRGYPSGDGTNAPALPRYECSALFKNPHPWDSDPAWPTNASTALLQALVPGDRKLNQWQVLVLAAPPGSSQYGTPPPASLLSTMFDSVSASNDPINGGGGLGIPPSEFLRTAPHVKWSDANTPGTDHCFWESP